MPLIEELPTTTTIRASHGWAYVPDTGPTKAILPGNRKRGAARESATNRGDGSAKQAKIVQARLADLEKENYKDTTIPIPTRPKDKGELQKSSASNFCMTVNRKRSVKVGRLHLMSDASSPINVHSHTTLPMRRRS